MNNFWLKKCEKSVTDIRKRKQQKRVFLVNDRECFALSHFIFTNQNQVLVSVSLTVKVVNAANYHITITMRDLGNPNYIHLQLYHFLVEQPQVFIYSNKGCRITVVHLKNLRVPIFIHIHSHTSRKSLLREKYYKLVRFLIRTK